MPQSASNDLNWQCVPFAQLGTASLYELLQLRSAVFVIEQACVFQDMDGLDAQAMHLLGTRGDKLLAYARCFNAGVSYPEASIGRVATHASVRGSGAGHALMQQALHCMQTQWGAQPVRIGAQAHLQGFYAQHGFMATGDGYVEDGIAHVQMLRA
jgi:ElaA protein